MVSTGQKLCLVLARYVQKPALMVPLPFSVGRVLFDLNAIMLHRTPRDMVIEPTKIGEIPCAWITRRGQVENGVLFYLHGGGFVMGSLRSHRHLVACLAQKAGLRGLFVDYRLAPEHPFPAGPDDALTAYQGLLASGVDPAKIALAGDSAGAGMVAVLLQDIKRLGLTMPRAAVLISPLTDATGGSPSLQENRRRDPVLPLSWALRAMRIYVGDHDPADPRISPLLGDLEGMPPMIVQACETEILRDDAIRYAEAVRAAGGKVELNVWSNVQHVWHLMCGRVTEADRGVAQLANFLNSLILGRSK